MTKFKTLPSQAELHELFDYSPVTGELYWRVKYCKKVKIGNTAGHEDKIGTREVSINGQRYKAYRLIWVWVTGEDPGAMEIDHINGIRSCNAFHNLRLANRAQNGSNRFAKGYRKRGNTWQARIVCKGKEKVLGSFPTESEARAAYEKASRDLRGEFSPIG